MKTNTELCVDLKTRLISDARMKPGKNYYGILRLKEPTEVFGYIDEGHFSFIETKPVTAGKRNVPIYTGKSITMTLRPEDGHLRLNFKEINFNGNFNKETFADRVKDEILEALSCRVEEGAGSK